MMLSRGAARLLEVLHPLIALTANNVVYCTTKLGRTKGGLTGGSKAAILNQSVMDCGRARALLTDARRRRSNRPGNSQANGPQSDDALESGDTNFVITHRR